MKPNRRIARTVPAGTGKRAWKKHALVLAAVIGFTLLAYSNSFQAPFLLDNTEIILKDQRVHEVTSHQIHRILTGEYWETAPTGLYRPLTTLSYLFNFSVLGNGANPAGYHWFNFILHAVNIALVYALCLILFEDIPTALVVSALWGVHPLHTEVVTNIVGRADMLAAFGVLAGVLAWRKALQSSGARLAAWLGAAALAVTIGIFSEEGAIVVLGAAALYDLAFRPRAARKVRVLSYAALALPCIVFLAVRARVLAASPYLDTQFCDNPLLGADFWVARLTAVKVIGNYFLLLVWPAHLSPDYSYNQIPLFGGLSHPEGWKTAAALAFVLAILAAGLWFYRRSKPVFFFVLFFFVALSPVSNIFILIGRIMGERFVYLPAVGFVAVCVWALRAVWQRLPASRPEYQKGARAVVAVIALALAARTFARNNDWLDQQRFWQSAVEVAPGSYKTQISAATSSALDSQQDWDRCLRHVDAALSILDGLPDERNAPNAYLDAGRTYRLFGEAVEARKAAPSRPGQSNPAYWYGKSLSALLRAERIELIADERYRLRNARRGKPGLTVLASKFYLELGRTYVHLGEQRKALTALERGRMLESDPDLLEDLAAAYASFGESHNAAVALVEALAVDPSRVSLIASLVDLYGRIDSHGCAVTRQGGQAGVNWDCPAVHADICAASRNVAGNFDRRGQPSDAAAIRKTAVQDLGCAPELLGK